MGQLKLTGLFSVYRNQWPRLAGTFVTSVFSYDHNFEKYNSGLGLLASVDKVGIGGFQSTTLSGIYSYYIPLGNDWIIRGGLQFTYANRNVNFYELTFNDQIKRWTVYRKPYYGQYRTWFAG